MNSIGEYLLIFNNSIKIMKLKKLAKSLHEKKITDKFPLKNNKKKILQIKLSEKKLWKKCQRKNI